MKTISRIVAVALAIACVAAYYLGHSDWMLPIAALACVAFFLGVRFDLVKTRDRALAEATSDDDSETQR